MMEETGPLLLHETSTWSEVEPEFSIVTATFQRNDDISKLLPSIFEHIGIEPSRYDYIVCDNCSTDGTDETVIAALKQNDHIAARYYRQHANLGLDQNIQDVLGLARGKYVWFIADDDDIAPGVLGPLSEAVISSQLPLIIVRANNIQEWDALPLQNQTEFLIEIDPANPRWAKTLLATSFLASMVFRRDQIEQFQPKIRGAFGTNYSPWALGLAIMSAAQTIGYVDTLCVLGNINFDGQNRFHHYKTLVKGRIDVWNRFSSAGVKKNLANEMKGLSQSAWKSAAAGNMKIGASRREMVREYSVAFDQFGASALRSLPWAVVASALPASVRRSLNRLRKSEMQ